MNKTFPLEGRDLTSISRDEIIASIPISPTIRLGQVALSIAQVSSTGVVKWGRHIQLHEAKIMQYIAKHTTILLPTVIDAWEDDDATEEEGSNTCYIFMEFIPGKLIYDIWNYLDEDGRQNIYSQIYDYILQLRTLEVKSPGPMGGGISEGALFTSRGAGPFHTAKELEDWYNNRLQVCHDSQHAKSLPPGVFSGTFKKMVICHMDLHQRNVIIDNGGKVWLIDWGSAGAYPTWFEEAHLTYCASASWELGLLDLVKIDAYSEDVARLLATVIHLEFPDARLN